MTAASQHPTTSPARLGRRLPPKQSRPIHRRAGRKLASGVFRSAPPARARKVASLTLGTHQENSVFSYDFASDCAVAPNTTARDDLIRQAGVITRRMNDTLSDMNVVEGNIRLGEGVSTAHMVLSEGFEAGAVIGKGFGVLKNVFTLGGYVTRGAGTLGAGGRVLTGMPGTAAGDIVNASIRGQQLGSSGGSVLMEAGETLFGAGVLRGTGALVNEFRDATNSGSGAVSTAYNAAGMLESSYYQDAARLKAIRQQLSQGGRGP